MLGDKRAARRHQEYLDSRRRDRERTMRSTLAKAAGLTGMALVVRVDTWNHLLTRPHLGALLAGIDASRIDGDPASVRATLTVTLSGPQLVHLAAGLFADKETDDPGPAEEATRAIAGRLYPVLAAAIDTACPGSPYLGPAPATARELATVVLDAPSGPPSR
ncbi:hypothetical protein [Kitasatospora sp. NPDC088351]|uniref:hypothetical protein n=1 Tax=Kitasatospora sp. NPDC088351 TaxID=3155180 RepID=UPI00343277B3